MIKISHSAYEEIKKLSKNNSYSNIIRDIKNINFEIAIKVATIIYKDNEIALYKIRCNNSNNNRGKRAGYRIIFLEKKKDIIKEIIILKVYPKTGTMAKENITDDDLKEIISKSIDDDFINLI